jgi:hypothetical protein
MYVALTVTVLTVVFMFAVTRTAPAFDTGVHAEIVESAAADDGFGADAVDVMAVNNWMTDFYQWISASNVPYSGHSGLLARFAAGNVQSEHWSLQIINAATRLHFDNVSSAPLGGQNATLYNSAAMEREWERLRIAVGKLAREARDKNDPLALDTVLGISSHAVQDFYAHTNWVEPRHGLPGADGPGWQERGFGSNPTWFDVPASAREASIVYGDTTPGHFRTHGNWNADNNESVASAMNKDWSGRPYYDEAYESAYFATRQWFEAVRRWINDDAFWEAAQRYHPADRVQRIELNHEVRGRTDIMTFLGHFMGEGEPAGGIAPGVGGSLLDLRDAINFYYTWSRPSIATSCIAGCLPGVLLARGVHAKTIYRRLFEQLVTGVAERNPVGEPMPIVSSEDLQRRTKFEKLEVLALHSHGLGDPGPAQADMYGKVRLDGQEMSSAIIFGRDDFTFPKPYDPFTFIKPVPATPNEGTPVESVEVEIETSCDWFSGTDDEVSLVLAPGLSFPLDKGWTNDFERCDKDKYSVPIDGAAWNGMRVGNITEVGLRKSGDGTGGNWKADGLKLWVKSDGKNRLVYDNQRIFRWFGDGHLLWIAPNFERTAPRGAKTPVCIDLLEQDKGTISLLGDDDQGDINPFDARNIECIGYEPGLTVRAWPNGGNALGGRGDIGGDHASIAYQIQTDTPVLPQTEAPPARTGLPDLKITAFDIFGVTVENVGTADAGSFRLAASSGNGEETLNFPQGLAAGASVSRPLGFSCIEDPPFFAFVDSSTEVDESDETNNIREDPEEVIC